MLFQVKKRFWDFLKSMDDTQRDNLRRIVDRLPLHLKTKWLEVANSTQVGQRLRIHHISQFVTTKARVANNPVFGGPLTNVKERSKSLSPRAKILPLPPKEG